MEKKENPGIDTNELETQPRHQKGLFYTYLFHKKDSVLNLFKHNLPLVPRSTTVLIISSIQKNQYSDCSCTGQQNGRHTECQAD